jgi:hypothetical protein
MKITALLSAAALAAFASFGRPIVQVRDFPGTPNLSVVAWDSDNAEVGLRTRLRHDGSHLGAGRVGEHALYLSSALVSAKGGFAHAVAQDGKLLRNMGNQNDSDACRVDNVCSPSTVVRLGVPDEWLRQHRDSVVVTLRPRSGQNWTVRLDGSLIGAYLATIDSVSASLKSK